MLFVSKVTLCRNFKTENTQKPSALVIEWFSDAFYSTSAFDMDLKTHLDFSREINDSETSENIQQNVLGFYFLTMFFKFSLESN